MRQARYDRFSVLLHWLMAVLILGQIALGLWMLGLPKDGSGLRASWFNVHKSWGMVLGLLAAVRLAWALLRPRVPELPQARARERRRFSFFRHGKPSRCGQKCSRQPSGERYPDRRISHAKKHKMPLSCREGLVAQNGRERWAMSFSGTRPNHEPGLGIYKNQRFEKIARHPLWAPPGGRRA